MKICNECGFGYDEALGACPECGSPNEYPVANAVNKQTNCPNCGAPVTNNVSCEYCESLLPKVSVPLSNKSNSGNGGTAETALGAAFLGGLLGGLFGD